MSEYQELIDCYCYIEHRLNKVRDIIAFKDENETAFGWEFYNIIFLSCSLFEICMKKYINNDEGDMNVWKKNSEWLRFVSDKKIKFHPMYKEIIPFSEFHELNMIFNSGKVISEKDKETIIKDFSLFWWNAYNDCKHDFINNFEKACLKNAIYSLGAAGIMVNLYNTKKVMTNPTIGNGLFYFDV